MSAVLNTRSAYIYNYFQASSMTFVVCLERMWDGHEEEGYRGCGLLTFGMPFVIFISGKGLAKPSDSCCRGMTNTGPIRGVASDEWPTKGYVTWPLGSCDGILHWGWEVSGFNALALSSISLCSLLISASRVLVSSKSSFLSTVTCWSIFKI